MIIQVSGSQQPINVSVTGSSQSGVSVGGVTIEPITLVVSTSLSPVNVSIPSYVSHAKTAGTASFAETASYSEYTGQAGTATTASYALTSAGVITNAVSSSYSEYAVSASVVPPTFPYVGTAVITGSLNTTNEIKTNKLTFDSRNGLFVMSSSITSGVFGVTENIHPLIPTSSFSGATIEYLARRPTGIRIGLIMGIWSGSSYTFTDVSSTDIGDTSDLVTGFLLVNENIIFQVHSAGSGSDPWTVQSIFKLFPLIN